MKKNVNKANALKNLLSMLKLKESETAVIGDSGNDVPLFDAFGQSYCMRHAPEEVRKSAKKTIKCVKDIEEDL